MTKTNSDEANQEDNRRVLIQIYYERINHLASLISNINGFIIAILIGIIVGIFAIKDFYGIIILTISGILSLIGWRINAHFIDEEIQEFYNLVHYVT